MRATPEHCFLLASHQPATLACAEPVLRAAGAHVEVVLTAEAALEAMLHRRPDLALVDAQLPGMELGQLLAAARAECSAGFPIVLIADTLSEELKERLAERVVDDLVPRSIAPQWLAMRLEMALRAWGRAAEMEQLRDRAAVQAERDPLTGVYNRNTLMSLLFRETDRVQRMQTGLCSILFDIDDFGHWNARLGPAACDQLLCRVVERINGLLRSYDMLGRMGKDEFLAVLPGCSAVNGVMLAERMRAEVFGEPYPAAGRMVRLSACFAVVPSRGRSPVVVLREAEDMLRMAKSEGPETIQCVVELGGGDQDPQEPRTNWGELSHPSAAFEG